LVKIRSFGPLGQPAQQGDSLLGEGNISGLVALSLRGRKVEGMLLKVKLSHVQGGQFREPRAGQQGTLDQHFQVGSAGIQEPELILNPEDRNFGRSNPPEPFHVLPGGRIPGAALGLRVLIIEGSLEDAKHPVGRSFSGPYGLLCLRGIIRYKPFIAGLGPSRPGHLAVL